MIVNYTSTDNNKSLHLVLNFDFDFDSDSDSDCDCDCDCDCDFDCDRDRDCRDCDDKEYNMENCNSIHTNNVNYDDEYCKESTQCCC